MPTFIKPNLVHVESGGGGGGGGGLIAAAAVAVMVIVAVGAAVTWLVRELMAIWVELAIIAGGFVVIMGVAVTWMAIYYRRGRLIVYAAPKALAPARPVIAKRAPAIPVVAPPVHQVIVNSRPPAIVHQHLHLHGVTSEEAAAAVARLNAPALPAVKES